MHKVEDYNFVYYVTEPEKWGRLYVHTCATTRSVASPLVLSWWWPCARMCGRAMHWFDGDAGRVGAVTLSYLNGKKCEWLTKHFHYTFRWKCTRRVEDRDSPCVLCVVCLVESIIVLQSGPQIRGNRISAYYYYIVMAAKKVYTIPMPWPAARQER